MTRHRFRAVAVAIVTMAATAACSTAPPKPLAETPAPPSASASPTVSSSPSTPPAPPEPLTGLPGPQVGGAVVVPINVAKGVPAPVGLGSADIVSLEFSEQGAFHLVGIFQSKYPSRVGPVGEVRPSDLKFISTTNPLIAQAGAPAGFLDTAKAFNLAVRTGSKATAGFSSAGSGLYVNAAALSPAAKGQVTAMFEYAQTGMALSRLNVDTASKVVISASGHPTITWTLDDATNTWHTQIGGVAMTTTNLVIVTTPYDTKHVSALRRDLTFADPLGTGKATVVAGASVISATWSKKSFNSALNMLGPDQDIPQLTAGSTWVVWAPPGSTVTTS